jgi:hypothetical protein
MRKLRSVKWIHLKNRLYKSTIVDNINIHISAASSSLQIALEHEMTVRSPLFESLDDRERWRFSRSVWSNISSQFLSPRLNTPFPWLLGGDDLWNFAGELIDSGTGWIEFWHLRRRWEAWFGTSWELCWRAIEVSWPVTLFRSMKSVSLEALSGNRYLRRTVAGGQAVLEVAIHQVPLRLFLNGALPSFRFYLSCLPLCGIMIGRILVGFKAPEREARSHLSLEGGYGCIYAPYVPKPELLLVWWYRRTKAPGEPEATS